MLFNFLNQACLILIKLHWVVLHSSKLWILVFEVHARRLAALKALTSSSTSNSEMLEKLYEIVFGILEKVDN